MITRILRWFGYHKSEIKVPCRWCEELLNLHEYLCMGCYLRVRPNKNQLAAWKAEDDERQRLVAAQVDALLRCEVEYTVRSCLCGHKTWTAKFETDWPGAKPKVEEANCCPHCISERERTLRAGGGNLLEFKR